MLALHCMLTINIQTRLLCDCKTQAMASVHGCFSSWVLIHVNGCRENCQWNYIGVHLFTVGDLSEPHNLNALYIQGLQTDKDMILFWSSSAFVRTGAVQLDI